MVLEKFYIKKKEERVSSVITTLGPFELREPDYAEMQTWSKEHELDLKDADLPTQTALLLSSFSTNDEIRGADMESLVKDCRNDFTQGDLLAFVEWFSVLNGGNLEIVHNIINSKNPKMR